MTDISHIQVQFFTFSKTHKTKTGIANTCQETSNSNPPGPNKLSSQSTAGLIRLCCTAFYQPQHPVEKGWVI
jgi:hypothetical protein